MRTMFSNFVFRVKRKILFLFVSNMILCLILISWERGGSVCQRRGRGVVANLPLDLAWTSFQKKNGMLIVARKKNEHYSTCVCSVSQIHSCITKTSASVFTDAVSSQKHDTGIECQKVWVKEEQEKYANIFQLFLDTWYAEFYWETLLAKIESRTFVIKNRNVNPQIAVKTQQKLTYFLSLKPNQTVNNISAKLPLIFSVSDRMSECGN